MEDEGVLFFTLVARKPRFGLPTACPVCLPVYIYLKLSQFPFELEFNSSYPDSDQIPFVEIGYRVAYNNEKGGVIQSLKENGEIDLDSGVGSVPEFVFMKAMVESSLADAVMYELWLGPNSNVAKEIYYSDLPWPIGKILHFKQARSVKQLLGITSENAERREEEIYRMAEQAYSALATRLGDESFFFENRPTSLDAYLLSNLLFTIALPETSVLRSKLISHPNLLSYAENLKMKFLDTPEALHDPSSSTGRRVPTYWSTKPKKPKRSKREKSEEEKKLKRRGKYFLAAQFVAVLVFLSVLGRGYDDDDGDVEMDEENQVSGLDYE
ncbi:hypothetical protein M569_05543 [Genlisea aurea]|uniref:Metaxin n=1 Tax=Genlisea aurea TaxID=192259 RepID=S8CW90_9LAMI|nr:hypothetical protein M569_05543 [Genlisea aurea]